MLRVGIIFGGCSREREVSFAGGRTVYDNLNKTLFEPIPIFIDSYRQWIILEQSYLYKGTIRDFYPPISFLDHDAIPVQIYAESLDLEHSIKSKELANSVGTLVNVTDLKDHIDFAFLCLHGEMGEDGQIQGLLDYLQIPFSGSGILPSAIGMDKSIQKKWMKVVGFESPSFDTISREEWIEKTSPTSLYNKALTIGFPLVIRPCNQGSSIGVTILSDGTDIEQFANAVDKALFVKTIEKEEWSKLDHTSRLHLLTQITDLRDGIGFPLSIIGQKISSPDALLRLLNEWPWPEWSILLEGYSSETKVLLEGFIDGREFSCIVVRNEDGTPIALPPTEIIKGKELFDYRSKYLPGLSRKETPIDVEDSMIEMIRAECVRLFEYFEFNTYARIDGFLSNNGKIILNDPNTTSGMMPSSFFFHQAAEIGLNPSQFLTYIISMSLKERADHSLNPFVYGKVINHLNELMHATSQKSTKKQKIGIIMGGYSFERHISMESGRNIYEKLSGSTQYEPIPLFLVGENGENRFFRLPIHLMLKDNADDIKDKILSPKIHQVTAQIRQKAFPIIEKYAGDVHFEPVEWTYCDMESKLDGVFIALHGRPGEDGEIQKNLDQYGIPYNGSGVPSSSITIDKYQTLQLLKSNGFCVADQLLLAREEWQKEPIAFVQKIKENFAFPFVIKPVDDGCSSAVMIIKSEEQLVLYLGCLFRNNSNIDPSTREGLGLTWNEEFPMKEYVLIETLITKEDSKHFLEITGGLLTHYQNGKLIYEMFEPSEALSTGEVLSLEEKFLAGEGQNITPARYDTNPDISSSISKKVQEDLRKAAELLKVEGYARIDAFVRIYSPDEVETIIVEVNSLPGMTPATCIFHQCAINGYTPLSFIDSILQFGFERNKNK